MTIMIQMLMLGVAAAILLSCKDKAKDVGNGTVLRAGMGALISDYGGAWMGDT